MASNWYNRVKRVKEVKEVKEAKVIGWEQLTSKQLNASTSLPIAIGASRFNLQDPPTFKRLTTLLQAPGKPL